MFQHYALSSCALTCALLTIGTYHTDRHRIADNREGVGTTDPPHPHPENLLDMALNMIHTVTHIY